MGHGLGFGQEQQEDPIALGFSGALRLGVEGVRCGLRLLLELVLACAWSALIGRKVEGREADKLQQHASCSWEEKQEEKEELQLWWPAVEEESRRGVTAAAKEGREEERVELAADG